LSHKKGMRIRASASYQIFNPLCALPIALPYQRLVVMCSHNLMVKSISEHTMNYLFLVVGLILVCLIATFISVIKQFSEDVIDQDNQMLPKRRRHHMRSQYRFDKDNLTIEDKEYLYSIFMDEGVSLNDVILDNHDCFKPRMNETKSIATRARISENYEIPSKPFLNLGMPKAGSTTLHDFFKCAGYTTSHWICPGAELPTEPTFCGLCMYNAVLEGKPPLKSCGDTDAFMQMDITDLNISSSDRQCIFPQHELLEKIHAEAPNATFILPFRKIKPWLISILAWGDKYNYDYLGWIDKSCPYDGLLGGIIDAAVKEDKTPNMVPGWRFGRLAQFVCNHVTKVRDFVEKHPSHILIEYELEDEDSGQYLLDIFQEKNKSCWGRSNFNEALYRDPSIEKA